MINNLKKIISFRKVSLTILLQKLNFKYDQFHIKHFFRLIKIIFQKKIAFELLIKLFESKFSPSIVNYEKMNVISIKRCIPSFEMVFFCYIWKKDIKLIIKFASIVKIIKKKLLIE